MVMLQFQWYQIVNLEAKRILWQALSTSSLISSHSHSSLFSGTHPFLFSLFTIQWHTSYPLSHSHSSNILWHTSLPILLTLPIFCGTSFPILTLQYSLMHILSPFPDILSPQYSVAHPFPFSLFTIQWHILFPFLTPSFCTKHPVAYITHQYIHPCKSH